MRPSLIRALLLALAMVAQTIASGASAARMAPVATSQILAPHCEHMRAQDSAPSDNAKHRQMCQSCLFCAGPPADVLAWRMEIVVPPSSFASSDRPKLTSPARLGARLTQTNRARAPPSAA